MVDVVSPHELQDDRRGVGGAGLAVEDPVAVDGDGPVVDRASGEPQLPAGGDAQLAEDAAQVSAEQVSAEQVAPHGLLRTHAQEVDAALRTFLG